MLLLREYKESGGLEKAAWENRESEGGLGGEVAIVC